MMTPQAGTTTESPSCMSGARRIIGLCGHTCPAAFYHLLSIVLDLGMLSPDPYPASPSYSALPALPQWHTRTVVHQLQASVRRAYAVGILGGAIVGIIQNSWIHPGLQQWTQKRFLVVDVLRWKALTYKVPWFETLKKWGLGESIDACINLYSKASCILYTYTILHNYIHSCLFSLFQELFLCFQF